MATILIIEDRPVNLRFVATLLRDRGYRLLEARGGEEARTCKKNPGERRGRLPAPGGREGALQAGFHDSESDFYLP